MIKTPFRHRGSSNPKRSLFGVVQPDAAVILAALALPVIVIDRSGGIRFVNPAAEQFFGSGAAALWGSALADVVARFVDDVRIDTGIALTLAPGRLSVVG